MEEGACWYVGEGWLWVDGGGLWVDKGGRIRVLC